jgi:hypothetical protein
MTSFAPSTLPLAFVPAIVNVEKAALAATVVCKNWRRDWRDMTILPRKDRWRPQRGGIGEPAVGQAGTKFVY